MWAIPTSLCSLLYPSGRNDMVDSKSLRHSKVAVLQTRGPIHLQEDQGEVVAQRILEFMERHPL
jgi:hypothetical protein